MADLPNTVATDFAWYYEFIAAHVHKWVDPLTQEQFWHNPFTYGNSVGHLILHLTGNLELLHRSARGEDRIHSRPQQRIHGNRKTRQSKKCWKPSTRPLRWLCRQSESKSPKIGWHLIQPNSNLKLRNAL